MNFQQAFDPMRALSESWRLLGRAPVLVLLGGIAVFVLTDGENGSIFKQAWDRESLIRWRDFPDLFLQSVVGAFSCFVNVIVFLLACFFMTSFAGVVERLVREGRSEGADLLNARGRFGKQVLASFFASAALGLASLPMLGAGWLVLLIGDWLGMQWVTSLGMLAVLVIGLPLLVYVLLGLRLTELAVAIEGLDPVEAMKRSWTLVEGNRLWFLFYLVVTAVFAALGTLLCCVGVLVTGTMRVVALNESYLRLVTPDSEQQEWWSVRGDPQADSPSRPGGVVVDPRPSPGESPRAARMNPDLSQSLRRVLELIEEHGRGDAASSRARDRLVRDLLPRTVGGTPYLVVGIVGPNNSGKSALFNGLVGAELSPSLPTGGATRRLFGAAAPQLLERMAADPALERFPLVRAEQLGPEQREHQGDTTEDPSELLAFAVDLPDGLLLIDTPDFDSIMEENRLASESLLAVADLAVAVVTRHTYQNREVVLFLQRWLSHGRPWLLVYNEAPSHELALEHGEKLAADLGSAPLAVFSAPHSLEVQEGGRLLSPAATLDSQSVPLREFLLDVERVGEVKQRALEASLAQLTDDLELWIRELGEEADNASELRSVAEKHVDELTARIAGCAMPGGPFIEAFRAVLDRRTNALSRRLRLGLRKLRLKIESIPALFSARSETERKGERASLADVERAEFERAWPAFWEGLMRDLGPEGRVVAREHASRELADSLDRELTEQRTAEVRERMSSRIGESAVDLEAFQDVCEVLVEQAIAERGRDWDIQAAADVAMVAPIAIATAVIIKTGGLGSDVGVAGGAALSSYLFEKYSHLLGTRITNEAARSWAESREIELAPEILASVLPESEARMRETEEKNRTLIEELTRLRGALAS